MNIYSIHDSAACFFMPPFMARTDGEASRMFVGFLGNSFSHRGDFTLCHLGTFDPDKGVVVGIDLITVLKGLSIDAKFDPALAQGQLPLAGLGLPPERGADTHDQNGALIK